MKTRSGHPSHTRRWLFYSSGHLTLGASVRRVGSRALLVHVVETRWHAESNPLPQRLKVEERVRSAIRDDLSNAVGSDWAVTFRFDPQVRTETDVAHACVIADDPFGSFAGSCP